MTDREKLLRLIGEAQDGGYDVTDVVEMSYTTNEYLADHLLANGVTFATDNNVGKWIPVTERLPDLELVDAKANDRDLYPCLCVVKPRRARGRRYVTKLFYDGENFMDRDMCPWTFETTHWMPLPPPPKEEWP